MAKVAKTADRQKVMDTTKSTDCPKCSKPTRIVKRVKDRERGIPGGCIFPARLATSTKNSSLATRSVNQAKSPALSSRAFSLGRNDYWLMGTAVSSSSVLPLSALLSAEKMSVGLLIGIITFEFHFVWRTRGGSIDFPGEAEEIAEMLAVT